MGSGDRITDRRPVKTNAYSRAKRSSRWTWLLGLNWKFGRCFSRELHLMLICRMSNKFPTVWWRRFILVSGTLPSGKSRWLTLLTSSQPISFWICHHSKGLIKFLAEQAQLLPYTSDAKACLKEQVKQKLYIYRRASFLGPKLSSSL